MRRTAATTMPFPGLLRCGVHAGDGVVDALGCVGKTTATRAAAANTNGQLGVPTNARERGQGGREAPT